MNEGVKQKGRNMIIKFEIGFLVLVLTEVVMQMTG